MPRSLPSNVFIEGRESTDKSQLTPVIPAQAGIYTPSTNQQLTIGYRPRGSDVLF